MSKIKAVTFIIVWLNVIVDLAREKRGITFGDLLVGGTFSVLRRPVGLGISGLMYLDHHLGCII